MLKGIIFGSNDVGTSWSEVMESFGGIILPIVYHRFLKFYYLRSTFKAEISPAVKGSKSKVLICLFLSFPYALVLIL